jgi:hypothetical protein
MTVSKLQVRYEPAHDVGAALLARQREIKAKSIKLHSEMPEWHFVKFARQPIFMWKFVTVNITTNHQFLCAKAVDKIIDPYR